MQTSYVNPYRNQSVFSWFVSVLIPIDINIIYYEI